VPRVAEQRQQGPPRADEAALHLFVHHRGKKRARFVGKKKWKNAKKLFPLQVYNPLTFEEEEQQRGARRGLARRAGGQVGQR